MDNEQTIAYAVVAVSKIKDNKEELNKHTIESYMRYLFDVYSENEIISHAEKIK